FGVKSKFPCSQGKTEAADQRQLDSFCRCRPDVSKFSGSSQRSNAVFSAGHSLSRIENQQVSRLRILVNVAWRNIHSYGKTRRCAAARDGALSASHFHS